MFILPALLYLNVLPLFGQCLYHLIVPNKSRPPHAVGAALSQLVLSSTGLTPFLGRPGQCGYFCITPGGRAFVPLPDMRALSPHARRISIRIRFKLETSGPIPETLPIGHCDQKGFKSSKHSWVSINFDNCYHLNMS
ncbi:hypothetical protein AVEN_213045-1 [Araneus ventricosus]|uniref:Secreted protein n=1 Tax=Araneus ventricosus TaxID=182803 RepID=A0A4Y2VQG3_ARAVE|nr:hypothetical protein AVEN_213045-1 [Araneus ventricosus]